MAAVGNVVDSSTLVSFRVLSFGLTLTKRCWWVYDASAHCVTCRFILIVLIALLCLAVPTWVGLSLFVVVLCDLFSVRRMSTLHRFWLSGHFLVDRCKICFPVFSCSHMLLCLDGGVHITDSL